MAGRPKKAVATPTEENVVEDKNKDLSKENEELKNLIERMALLSKDKILDVEQLPLEIKTKSDIVENKTVVGVGPLKEILEQEIYSLEEVERVVIAIALQKTRWNKQETSKILGIGRTTLYEKIRKYGLDTK